jgi:RHS repeat-associated protein
LNNGHEYGPFGEVLRATGPMAKANPFRFSTKYQDDETDLLYYGYRYYNASTGRWLSRDPIAERGGDNLYSFLSDAPLSYVDILGLECVGPIVVNLRYDFDTDKLRIPPLPGPGIYVDGRARIEVQTSTVKCRKCCPNGSTGWRSETDVKGLFRAGVTITGGWQGSLTDDGYGISYWAGVPLEFSGQGQGSFKVITDDCKNRADVGDYCFGVKLFGRASGGGQFRVLLGRWGVATGELTINGELYSNGKVCFHHCGPDGCGDVTFDDGGWHGRVYTRECFGFVCLTQVLMGDGSDSGDSH